MGSSAKKKKEKKKDFQKTKLKVGKAKPAAANATSTSFKAKAIVLNQQISIEAPSFGKQFLYHVSLLSSRTESQRKESLAYLTSTLSSEINMRQLPVPAEALLDKAMPLLLDSSTGVRTELLRFLRVLPKNEVGDHVSKMLPFIRAAMTHLVADIRKTALDVLSWLLDTAGIELVSSPGGWIKTLECCSTLLNWKDLTTGDVWTASKTHFRTDTKAIARAMQVVDELLNVGLVPKDEDKENSQPSTASFPLWDTISHQIPNKANAYGYLNLFGKPVDNESQMLEDREERLTTFDDRFKSGFLAGIDGAKREGGDIGRVSGQLSKTLTAAYKDHV